MSADTSSFLPPSKAFPDRPHLKESRQLNWNRVTSSEAAIAVVDGLVAEFEAQEVRKRARRTDDKRRLRTTFMAMALDLFYSTQQDRRLYIAYSRSKEEYETRLTRYLQPDITHTTAVDVADFLEANGYAEGTKGSFVREDLGEVSFRLAGYRSRLKPTDKFISLFTTAGVTRDDIQEAQATETIRLKGPPEGRRWQKPLLPYVDDSNTNRMRSDLRDWTELARSYDITVDAFDPLDLEKPEQDDESAGDYMDTREIRLYRVFNDGAWNRGGRFYGGWWQSLPKAKRKTIRIDGEPTVELDFKSFHPRLIYHLEGRPLEPDDDPYFLTDPHGVDRDILKVTFNQLLAINGDGRPKKPAKSSLPRNVSYKAVADALEQKHFLIASWLRRGLSTRVQFFDSRIAAEVMKVFTQEFRRPVLPIHDSFIVAASDEARLGETMSLAYRGQMLMETGIGANPIISGWTSPGVEAAVTALLPTPEHDIL